MPGPTIKPLATRATYQQLVDAQAALSRAADGMSVLEACGVDCQHDRAVAAATQANLDRTMKAFFPSGPPRK